MTKITAPNKEYTGTSASVEFTDGVGYTDNAWLIEWFTQHGYQIGPQEAQNEPQEAEEVQPEAEIPQAVKKRPAKGTKKERR